MACFPKYSISFTLQKTPKFLEIWTKLQMSKLEETFSISDVLGILCLARMFYIIYIKQIFDWNKNEQIGITFLQVGKQIMHKLCQNKHFNTAGTVSPNSKKQNVFLLPKCHSFQPFIWLIKISFSFSLPRAFSCRFLFQLLSWRSLMLLFWNQHIISMAFFVYSSKAGVQAWNRGGGGGQMSIYFEA